MGQEYQLKKLYESLLKGEKAKEESKSPRTLSEAYQQKVLSERTVFFAKDNDKYTTLGIVEDPNEAKEVVNRIKSYAVFDNVKDIVTSAGWSAKNTIFDARTIAELFTTKNFSPQDVFELSDKKEKLDDIVKKYASDSSFRLFNLYDCLYDNLIGAGAKLQTPKESFYEVYDTVYNIRGQEGAAGTGVGPAEVLLSLFTSAIKSKGGGDLNFNGVGVEVKSTDARLGYADFAKETIRAKMIEHLGEKSVNRDLAQVKGEMRALIKELQTKASTMPSYKVFTETFFEALNTIYATMGSPELKQTVDNLGFERITLPSNASQTTIQNRRSYTVNLFKKLKYLKDNVEANEETTFDIIRGVVSFVREKSKKALEKGTKTKSAEDFKKIKGVGSAITQFFTTDLGLEPQTIRDILLHTRPYEDMAEDLVSEINKYVTDSFIEDMTHGNVNLLRQVIFAIQVSEYARKHNFSFLLLTNRQSRNALMIPASKGFGLLFSEFPKFKNVLDLNISFSDRGAYQIILR